MIYFIARTSIHLLAATCLMSCDGSIGIKQSNDYSAAGEPEIDIQEKTLNVASVHGKKTTNVSYFFSDKFNLRGMKMSAARAATRAAMTRWEAVANVAFTEVGSIDRGALMIDMAAHDAAARFNPYKNSIVINSKGPNPTTSNWTDSQVRAVLSHEIGHFFGAPMGRGHDRGDCPESFVSDLKWCQFRVDEIVQKYGTSLLPNMDNVKTELINNNLTISWMNPANKTTTYEVWLENTTSGERDYWNADEILSSPYTLPFNLDRGSYKVWVRGKVGDRIGNWSSYQNVLVNDEVSSLVRLQSQMRRIGFYSNGNYYQNHHGKNEKYVQGRDGRWYFILPNGELYMQSVTNPTSGSRIAVLPTLAYSDPQSFFQSSSLSKIESITTVSVSSRASVLQSNYGFSSSGNFSFNYAKLGEKWFKSRYGEWFFIIPAGTIFEGNKKVQIARLDSSFYQDPTRIFVLGR